MIRSQKNAACKGVSGGGDEQSNDGNDDGGGDDGDDGGGADERVHSPRFIKRAEARRLCRQTTSIKLKAM